MIAGSSPHADRGLGALGQVGKGTPCPAPPREGSVPMEVGDTPSSQPKISVCVLLPRATRGIVGWAIELLGVMTYEMFRARTKDKESDMGMSKCEKIVG